MAEINLDTLPIIVDLDGTLVETDTLYELFIAALVTKPFQTLLALLTLSSGIAAFKAKLSSIKNLHAASLPYRLDFVEYLRNAKENGRELHLATAADQSIAAGINRHIKLFDSIVGSNGTNNLKGSAKAAELVQRFPQGFIYAGDSTVDIPVWQAAAGAIVTSSKSRVRAAAAATGTPVVATFEDKPGGVKAWIKQLRPHQWSKNALVLAPVLLGAHAVTTSGIRDAFFSLILLCFIASLTYCINDLSDLAADRAHWSKKKRPFASGALPVRDGLVVSALGLPVLLGLGWLVSPVVALSLLAYVLLSLAYSFSLKRVPLLDTFVIGVLFTLRLVIGTLAAKLTPSPWLLTFSLFFFFSLAVAKRHTEVLRASEKGLRVLEGRGYHTSDKDLTLTFGVVSSMTSVVIVILYLVEEVFLQGTYRHPIYLWGAPVLIFLWLCRIWLLSHRGLLNDDPVIFALKDRVSLVMGILVLIVFLVAI